MSVSLKHVVTSVMSYGTNIFRGEIIAERYSILINFDLNRHVKFQTVLYRLSLCACSAMSNRYCTFRASNLCALF